MRIQLPITSAQYLVQTASRITDSVGSTCTLVQDLPCLVEVRQLHGSSFETAEENWHQYLSKWPLIALEISFEWGSVEGGREYAKALCKGGSLRLAVEIFDLMMSPGDHPLTPCP